MVLPMDDDIELEDPQINYVQMELSAWDKLFIIFLAGGLVLLVLILTVCSVSPFCWFYQCIHRKDKQFKKPKKTLKSNLESLRLQASERGQNENTPLQVALMQDKFRNGKSYSTTTNHDENNGGTTSPLNNNNVIHPTIRPTDSTYSSMSTCSHDDTVQPTTLSVHSEIQELEEPLVPNETYSHNYGQITLTVCYTCPEGQTDGQLLICVIEAEDLPPREYNGACDPYIRISVVKVKGRRSKSKKSMNLYTFITRTMKKTQHPIYKETFMAEINKSDLQDCVINIEACDDDRHANDTLLSQVKIKINEMHLVENEEPKIQTLDLTEPISDNGEVLFGLSYLPTAERLTVTINKTNNLKIPTTISENFCPFIRVLLLHNGKVIKRKKTAVVRGCDVSSTVSPIFDETLAFDVPNRELENVSLMILVCHKSGMYPESESDMSSPEGPVGSGPKHDKTRFVGKVVLGPKSHSTAAKQHWLSVLQCPRKQLSQWHTLH